MRENLDFLREIVRRDTDSGAYGGRVATRFPPEPNGYLHIGHAKSICLNFGIAPEFGGVCHLRFDDTNPTTEDIEYVESIERDVRWLGFDWGEQLFYASDYFRDACTSSPSGSSATGRRTWTARRRGDPRVPRHVHGAGRPQPVPRPRRRRRTSTSSRA